MIRCVNNINIQSNVNWPYHQKKNCCYMYNVHDIGRMQNIFIMSIKFFTIEDLVRITLCHISE